MGDRGERGVGGAEGEKVDAFLLRTCHISGGRGGEGLGRGGGAGGAEGGAVGRLSRRQPKPPPTTQLPRHFSSGWGAQKELAGGVVNFFPM